MFIIISVHFLCFVGLLYNQAYLYLPLPVLPVVEINISLFDFLRHVSILVLFLCFEIVKVQLNFSGLNTDGLFTKAVCLPRLFPTHS